MARLNKLLVTAAAIGLLSGCAAKTRYITAESWDDGGAGLYIAYWEGRCAGVSCDVGESLIKWCPVGDDNSLNCTNQTEPEALLNKKGKD